MKKCIFTCLLTLLSISVGAEGYQANLQSTRQTGMGHVGAALKLGAESMHFNPAGLVFMQKRTDLSVGASAVFATASYQGGGITAETDNAPSTPFFVYAGFRIFDNLAAGISVTTPYGSGLSWGKNWQGAHLVQDISLQTFAIQPTLSYKILPNLSVGAGLMVDFGNVSISRALMPIGFLQTIPNIGAILPSYEQYNDVALLSATLKGNSKISLGFNVGALWDISKKVSLGASFRSNVQMKVNSGTASLSYANETIKALLERMNVVPPLEQGTFRAEMPLPANLNVGVAYHPKERWLLSAEVQAVFWKTYKDLTLTFNEKALEIADIYAYKGYKNSCIFRVGGEYNATSRLDLRAGIYYDQTPIRKGHYNPETPGMDKLGISVGASFRPIEPISIDFAFLYIQGMGIEGSYPNPSTANPSNRFAGSYQTVAFAPSLGITARF